MLDSSTLVVPKIKKYKSDSSGVSIRELRDDVIRQILNEKKNGESNPQEVAAALRAVPIEIFDESEIKTRFGDYRERLLKAVLGVLKLHEGQLIVVSELLEEIKDAARSENI